MTKTPETREESKEPELQLVELDEQALAAIKGGMQSCDPLEDCDDDEGGCCYA